MFVILMGTNAVLFFRNIDLGMLLNVIVFFGVCRQLSRYIVTLIFSIHQNLKNFDEFKCTVL